MAKKSDIKILMDIKKLNKVLKNDISNITKHEFVEYRIYAKIPIPIRLNVFEHGKVFETVISMPLGVLFDVYDN